jgi:hypothetical protein
MFHLVLTIRFKCLIFIKEYDMYYFLFYNSNNMYDLEIAIMSKIQVLF